MFHGHDSAECTELHRGTDMDLAGTETAKSNENDYKDDRHKFSQVANHE